MSLLDLVPPHVRALKAYHAPSGTLPVRLDANESPWPFSQYAQAELLRALARVEMNRYPDATAMRLREAVAARYGGEPDAYVVGAGSDEVIATLLTAMAQPRQDHARPAILFPDPSFVMYAISGAARGYETVAVPLDETWDLDVMRFEETIRQHEPNVVFLPSPNNPTGNRFRTERLRSVIEAAPASLVVVDDAYGAFARDTLSPLCDHYPHVACLGTVSKIGVAAARAGWVRLPKPLREEVEKVRQPYNLSTLAQVAATLALTTLADALAEATARTIAERGRLAGALGAKTELTVFPSDANFLWVHYRGDADALTSKLRAHGVSIRSFHSRGGRLAGHLRITVGTPGENDRLLAALQVILER